MTSKLIIIFFFFNFSYFFQLFTFLDENIYIHDIKGCPQLIDSVYLKPTSKTPYDPYSLICLKELGRFNHSKLIDIKNNPNRYRQKGVGCKWGRILKKRGSR